MSTTLQKLSKREVLKEFENFLAAQHPTFSVWGWLGDAARNYKSRIGHRSMLAQNTDSDYARAIVGSDAVENMYISVYAGVLFLDRSARVYAEIEIFESPCLLDEPIIPFQEDTLIQSFSEVRDDIRPISAWKDWKLNSYLVDMMRHDVTR